MSGGKNSRNVRYLEVEIISQNRSQSRFRLSFPECHIWLSLGTSLEISFASFCNIVVSQRYTHSHSGQIDPVICLVFSENEQICTLPLLQGIKYSRTHACHRIRQEFSSFELIDDDLMPMQPNL